MNTRIILKVLRMRRQLRRRDRWTREQLMEHQTRSLQLLREYAYSRSPFYRRFHKGLEDRPLNELPVLTKATLMENFDQLVTDPMVRLADVEDHLLRSFHLGKHGKERHLPLEPRRVGKRPRLLQPLLRLGGLKGRFDPPHQDGVRKLHYPLAPVGSGRRIRQ
jgi:hypothetical protein